MRRNNQEFQKKKNVILFIFGYACQLCGLIDCKNHVHHIDRDNGNNDVFNLVPLCPDCHKLAHKLHVNIEIEYSAALRDQLQFLELHF
jgi:5-methylcytosine-specific restriction endonuclease McrA